MLYICRDIEEKCWLHKDIILDLRFDANALRLLRRHHGAIEVSNNSSTKTMWFYHLELLKLLSYLTATWYSNQIYTCNVPIEFIEFSFLFVEIGRQI
jgi:hypothetical protein